MNIKCIERDTWAILTSEKICFIRKSGSLWSRVLQNHALDFVANWVSQLLCDKMPLVRWCILKSIHCILIQFTVHYWIIFCKDVLKQITCTKHKTSGLWLTNEPVGLLVAKSPCVTSETLFSALSSYFWSWGETFFLKNQILWKVCCSSLFLHFLSGRREGGRGDGVVYFEEILTLVFFFHLLFF